MLAFNTFEQCFDLVVVGVIYLYCDSVAAVGGDAVCGVVDGACQR